MFIVSGQLYPRRGWCWNVVRRESGYVCAAYYERSKAETHAASLNALSTRI